ncbi:MAG: LytR C-terminal domain-containing protein [Patescibacteria group bacterium]|nr:LytR C-terminal domain-containing protein [Patescibacteria group bacterium]
MKRKKSKNGKNTKFAIIFFALVAGITVFSLLFKVLLLINQSRFDNQHRFTISVWDNKNPEVISFSPNSHSISILKLDGDARSLNLYRFLEIPIDARIKADFINTSENASTLLTSLLFKYKNIKSDINVIDIAKLYLFTKTVSPDQIYQKRISVLSNESASDKISSSLFSDEKITEENIRVEIVNASGVSGAGGRFARLINNMGGNVVFVSTALNNAKKSSILYSGKRTYTLDRLEKLLEFSVEKNSEKFIGDVIIRIGEDNKTSLKY